MDNNLRIELMQWEQVCLKTRKMFIGRGKVTWRIQIQVQPCCLFQATCSIHLVTSIYLGSGFMKDQLYTRFYLQ